MNAPLPDRPGLVVERELKFRSPMAVRAEAVLEALRELGLDLAPRGTAQHVDLYLDDDRHRLSAAERGLRLRRAAGRGLLACKEREQRAGPLHVHAEIEVPWDPAEAPELAADLPASLRDAVEPFVGDAPLRPFVALVVDRERLELVRGGEVLGEIALDRVTADLRGRTCTFFELELEVHRDVDACLRTGKHLEDTLPLESADDDKLTHALGLLSATPQRPRDRELEADPFQPFRDALQQAAMRAAVAESRVRTRGDEASVHELRTAGRRLRTWIRLLEPFLPPDVFLGAKQDAVDLHRAAAPARSLDVLRARLARTGRRLPAALGHALPALGRELESRRVRAAQDLADHLRTPEHGRRRTRLSEIAAHLSFGPEEIASAEQLAARLVRRAGKRLKNLVRSLPRGADWPRWHAARLAAKSLQILAVDLAPLRRLPSRTRFRLARCIAHLGRAGDAVDGVERWLGLAATPPCGEDPMRAALLGALGARCHERHLALRRRAERSLERLDRPRHWRACGLRG